VVIAALNSKVSPKFRSFCKSELPDKFLGACVSYFSFYFELQQALANMAAAAEALKAQGLDLDDPLDAVAAEQAAEVEAAAEEQAARLCGMCETRLRDVAAVYSAILIKNSDYANTQQERLFFESFYDFVARVLFTCNDRKRWHGIENELGRIFRSDHFNLARVRHMYVGLTPSKKTPTPSSYLALSEKTQRPAGLEADAAARSGRTL